MRDAQLCRDHTSMGGWLGGGGGGFTLTDERVGPIRCRVMADTELFRHHAQAIREGYARGLGCTPDAFEGERLTVSIASSPPQGPMWRSP